MLFRQFLVPIVRGRQRFFDKCERVANLPDFTGERRHVAPPNRSAAGSIRAARQAVRLPLGALHRRFAAGSRPRGDWPTVGPVLRRVVRAPVERRPATRSTVADRPRGAGSSRRFAWTPPLRRRGAGSSASCSTCRCESSDNPVNRATSASWRSLSAAMFGFQGLKLCRESPSFRVSSSSCVRALSRSSSTADCSARSRSFSSSSDSTAAEASWSRRVSISSSAYRPLLVPPGLRLFQPLR